MNFMSTPKTIKGCEEEILTRLSKVPAGETVVVITSSRYMLRARNNLLAQNVITLVKHYAGLETSYVKLAEPQDQQA